MWQNGHVLTENGWIPLAVQQPRMPDATEEGRHPVPQHSCSNSQ
jgi:hypothetical protein